MAFRPTCALAPPRLRRRSESSAVLFTKRVRSKEPWGQRYFVISVVRARLGRAAAGEAWPKLQTTPHPGLDHRCGSTLPLVRSRGWIVKGRG
jgi:hypothetical protein